MPKSIDTTMSGRSMLLAIRDNSPGFFRIGDERVRLRKGRVDVAYQVYPRGDFCR